MQGGAMSNLNIFFYYIILGLLYVVDSNDRERLREASDELFGILNSDEMRHVPVLILANKQDLPSKISQCFY